ncbi:MAG: crotonyl-CoA carboxylase/reductase, partial [Alphaproteobacteria bacterium]|nr:crotonyl-CoA carboxylase/reductase [Alphaproteobacteria bacterium]
MQLCALGEQPPLGEVPETMHAFLVRQDRFGEPKDAWQHEIIPVPPLKPDEVLVYVMPTGTNSNHASRAPGD